VDESRKSVLPANTLKKYYRNDGWNHALTQWLEKSFMHICFKEKKSAVFRNHHIIQKNKVAA
jgi:hypothetical protein